MLPLLFVLAAAPVKVAAPGFQTIGIDPNLSTLFVERFAVLAHNAELSIVTQRDVQSVLGLERQRQLLGCSGSSCMAELAGALGADAVLSGTLARAGSSLTLVLRVVRAADGSELASASVRAADEDGLQHWLEEHAAALGERIVARVRGLPDPQASRPPGWLRWASLGAGVLLGAGGGTLFGLSRVDAQALATASASMPVDATAVAQRGNAFEKSGLVLMSAGAALLVASVVLFALPARDSEFAVVPLSGGGGVLVWGGRFP